jgi:hypothetical protein
MSSTTNVMELIKKRFDSQRQQKIFAKAKDTARSMYRDQLGSMDFPDEIKQ